jgi:hypothetical protein
MLDRTEQDLIGELLSIFTQDDCSPEVWLKIIRLQKRVDRARNLKPDLKLEEMPEDGTEMAAQIAAVLSHKIVDHGIGAYEYWGARGVDVRKEPEIQQTEVWVQVTGVDDYDMIPARGKTFYSGGGCDGEHRGSCGDACAEVEVDFSIDLCDVAWTKECDLLLCYNVEQD